jgi:hypothetical protein
LKVRVQPKLLAFRWSKWQKTFLNSANDSNTGVEYSLHYTLIECLSPDDDVGTWKEIILDKILLNQESKSSAVVEHSPHHLVVEGLSTVKAACSEIEKMANRLP